ANGSTTITAARLMNRSHRMPLDRALTPRPPSLKGKGEKVTPPLRFGEGVGGRGCLLPLSAPRRGSGGRDQRLNLSALTPHGKKKRAPPSRARGAVNHRPETKWAGDWGKSPAG